VPERCSLQKSFCDDGCSSAGRAHWVEREVRRRPAGFAPVLLATALFTILSGEIAHRFWRFECDQDRFQYCAGIGFLGAGAIIRGSGGAIG